MSLTTVDADSFSGNVLKSTVPVIVLFSDASKNSSRNMLASLEAAAQDQGGAVQVVNKAFDKEGDVEKTYDVQSAPTTLFLKDGELKRVVVGFYQYEGVFKGWVDQLAQS